VKWSPDMEWKSSLRIGFLSALAWNLAWLVLCVVLIFDPELLLDQIGVSRTTASVNLLHVPLFGGVGSIIGFFYGFARCMIRKSPTLLDIHRPYFAKPFKGMLAGTLAAGLVYAVWRTWNFLFPILFTSTGNDAIGVVVESNLVYFTALGSGYNENAFFDMVGRLLKKVLPGATTSKGSSDVG
jgi:hypothetical protein